MSCGCGKTTPGKMLAGAAKLLRSELGLRVLQDEAAIQARRRACEACDQWDHGRCKPCGCYTFAKTRVPKETCPLGRWPDLPAVAPD